MNGLRRIDDRTGKENIKVDLKNITKTITDTISDSTQKAIKTIGDIGETVAETVADGSSKAGKVISDVGGAVADNAQKAAKAVGDTGTTAVETTTKAILTALDQNGDGQVDSTDIILVALKVPGIKINREEFLRKEFYKHCEADVIDKAVETNPATAGIDSELIDKIADEVIKFERNAVSGISAALGIPGGFAMAATIPADIAQYYGYMLRAAQKLLYLYGFPELDTRDNEVMLDSETLNSLTICLGIMYGVASANNAIKAMAKALASGVEKQLLRKALTKGTIYPIVKQVAKWFSVKMTKEVFAGFFKKTIPVLGGFVGGGITYMTFKPCCYRLKDALKDTMLSNPDHQETEEERDLFNDIKNGVIESEALEIDAENVTDLQIDVNEEGGITR